jgi:hypothetical protein
MRMKKRRDDEGIRGKISSINGWKRPRSQEVADLFMASRSFKELAASG